MKTRIHINQHHIKANAKGSDLPVITVKDYKRNRKTNSAQIVDSKGFVVARVMYRPDNPLPCGAKVWIETDLEIITSGIV
tara:strand:+ start:106 stop:345 length:240 start_codon:yes stop_codon:yes gene_type:complete